MIGFGPHLSLFDSVTVLASALAATVLMAVRRLRGVEREARQWLDDALNLGTVVVLAVLVISSFPWWSAPVAASPLTDIALIYCGGLIASAVWRSVRKPKD
ncbi:MAG: hypothetical protein JO303_15430 [Caulobacteraceae bacterium]|nr:hypothetical protein [Caulobacteraceae bacterium]